MTGHDDSRELFDAIVRRHEGTIKKIGALFYMPGSYHYDELVCDLTTYLWLVFYNLPRGTVISHEHAWVYSILYRKAECTAKSLSRIITFEGSELERS